MDIGGCARYPRLSKYIYRILIRGEILKRVLKKGKVREEILFLLLLTKTFSDYQAETKEEDKIVELFGQKARTLIEKRRQ